MKIQNTLFQILLIGISVSSIMCSGRFVKKDEIQYLEKKYAKEYVTKQKIDIGNNQFMKSGMKVLLFFSSGSESVKVYAYPANQPREEAQGKNILYLFETDFPDEKYKREIFEEKLAALVEEAK